MFWFVSALIGQFRIELNRAELVHGFFNLSKVVLPLMEPKIIESNNWFEAFQAWLTKQFLPPSMEGPLLTDSKNHAPALLHSSLTWIYQSEQRQIKTVSNIVKESWKKWIQRLIIWERVSLDDSGTRGQLRLCYPARKQCQGLLKSIRQLARSKQHHGTLSNR